MLARLRKSTDEKEGGFTLIELLVVIIIIGILAAIAIPVFLSQRTKGYDAQSKSDLRNFATQEETYNVDNNAYAAYAPVVAANGVFRHTSQLAVVGSSPTGFCLTANTAPSTKWFLYDSSQGGLSTTLYASQVAASAGCNAAVTGSTGYATDGSVH